MIDFKEAFITRACSIWKCGVIVQELNTYFISIARIIELGTVQEFIYCTTLMIKLVKEITE